MQILTGFFPSFLPPKIHAGNFAYLNVYKCTEQAVGWALELIKNIMLGKIEKIDLRDVWKHEASDFTNWLAQEENFQQLAEEIGNFFC